MVLVLVVHLGRSGDLVIQMIYIGLRWRWRVGGLLDHNICSSWEHTGFMNGPPILDVGRNKTHSTFGTKRLTVLPRYFAKRESWNDVLQP
jgi:hypothetical protein